MSTKAMRTVFDLLKQIEQRPSMYIGADDERERQLRNLEMLLHGYALALWQHGLDEPGGDFLQSFGAYLRERFGWSISAGPIAAVLRETGSATDAWRTFWAQVWEFRASVESTQEKE